MINKVDQSAGSGQAYKAVEKPNPAKTETKASSEEAGVVVDIGKPEDKNVTYKRPAARKPNAEEIKKLWEETERATDNLRKLVESLIGRQGKKVSDILEGKEPLIPDETARAEAEKAIAEDGEWGVKAVSTRIVEFAKAVSGGDKGKLEELKSAIEEGFGQAEKAFGDKLPEITRQTHDEIMRQLDEWAKEEE